MIKNTKLIFLRHGLTDLNTKNVYFGHSDPPLNNTGKLQVENVKKLLLNEKIDLIYSSDLVRCVESSKIINDIFKIEIILDNALRELNFGIFEGKSFSEISLEYPKESKLFFEDWKNYRIPQGESIKDLIIRVAECIGKIKNNNNEKTILIVTHSGVIQSAISYYLSKSLDLYWNFKIENASITKLCFDKDGFPFLEYVNRIMP